PPLVSDRKAPDTSPDPMTTFGAASAPEIRTRAFPPVTRSGRDDRTSIARFVWAHAADPASAPHPTTSSAARRVMSRFIGSSLDSRSFSRPPIDPEAAAGNAPFPAWTSRRIGSKCLGQEELPMKFLAPLCRFVGALAVTLGLAMTIAAPVAAQDKPK